MRMLLFSPQLFTLAGPLLIILGFPLYSASYSDGKGGFLDCE